jgi:hypothetical protein
MARSLLDKAKEDRRLDRRGYKSTLGRLFPHKDPRSPAMWRLAIIRDDLDHEVQSMVAPFDTDDDEGPWTHAYYLRRLCVSLLEAKNVLDTEVGPTLKKSRGPLRDVLRKPIAKLSAGLAKIEPTLRPLRDALGAHVRPNDANPDRSNSESYDVRGLRAHAEWPAKITFNKLTPVGTSYRGFTAISFLFAWPDVTDHESLLERANTFYEPIAVLSSEVAMAIDGVLYAFWLDLKAIAPMR